MNINNIIIFLLLSWILKHYNKSSDLSKSTTFFYNQQINLDIVMHLIIYLFIYYVCFEFNFFYLSYESYDIQNTFEI